MIAFTRGVRSLQSCGFLCQSVLSLQSLLAKNKVHRKSRSAVQVKALEEEVEDAVASAEAANMGKSAVEKDWTERLVKVCSHMSVW